MDFPMRGVTTQVYDPKSSTACTTALKKKPDTRGTTPSLLRISVILFHTALAWDKLCTIADQSFYAPKITCPRYLKEFTISRGRP